MYRFSHKMFSTLPEAIEKMVMAKSQIKNLIDTYNNHLCFSLIQIKCEIKKGQINNQLSENITILNKLYHSEFTVDELIEQRKLLSDKYNKYLNKINHNEL